MSVEGFAAIPNWMIRDESISAHAVAVYAALASHSGPGGIHPTQKVIASEARCSVRQVVYALNELVDLGVVQRVSRRRGEGQATKVSNGYILIPNGRLGFDEEPVDNSDKHGAGGARSQKLSAPGDEAKCTERQSTPLIEEEPMKKNPLYARGGVVDAVDNSFEVFWAVWPRKVAKPAAVKAFERAARRAAPESIVEGARRFAADPNLPGKGEERFIPHPATWLNEDRWNDPALPQRGGRSSGAQRDANALELAARYEAEQRERDARRELES